MLYSCSEKCLGYVANAPEVLFRIFLWNAPGGVYSVLHGMFLLKDARVIGDKIALVWCIEEDPFGPLRGPDWLKYNIK